MENLSETYNTLGLFFKEKMTFEPAIKLAKKAIKRLLTVSKRHPNLVSYYLNLSRAYFGEKKYENSFQYGIKSIYLSQNFLLQEHGDPLKVRQITDLLVIGYQLISEICQCLGDKNAAKTWMARATVLHQEKDFSRKCKTYQRSFSIVTELDLKKITRLSRINTENSLIWKPGCQCTRSSLRLETEKETAFTRNSGEQIFETKKIFHKNNSLNTSFVSKTLIQDFHKATSPVSPLFINNSESYLDKQ